MRNNKKKLLGLSLALMLGVGGLAGCAGSGTSEKTDSDGKTSFTIMANLYTPEVPSDKIEKLLEEKTGVDINIQWTPDTSYEEKLNTAFATESLPEAVFLKNQSTFIQFKEAIRDGQFWEIGPYLNEFPNLSKLNEQILQNTAVDGKIYSLYQGRPLSRQGLIYRKDWADRLGIEAPNTIEDVYEMARAFTEDDPDGNGKNDTFGITDRADLAYGAFKTVASWFGTPNGWGEKDGQLLPEFMFEEYIDTMDYIKKLRDNGYINQDFPVTSKEDQQAFFKNGTAGMYIGSMADVLSIHKDAVALNPDIEFEVHNQIVGPTGEYGIWAIPGYGNVVLFPKSSVKTEEQLKEILGFFDKLASPEMANLIFWGIEDEHYTVQDGRALASEDTDLTTREVKPYQSLEIGEPKTNGRYEGVFTLPVKEKAEELIIDNEDYLIHDPTVALDSATQAERGELLNQKINDATYQYILGDIDKDGFKKAIEDWKKSGGEDVIKEFNEAYQKIQ